MKYGSRIVTTYLSEQVYTKKTKIKYPKWENLATVFEAEFYTNMQQTAKRFPKRDSEFVKEPANFKDCTTRLAMKECIRAS